MEIKLPVAQDAINPVVRTSIGQATYAPEQEALIWRIKQLPGNREYLLRAKFSLPSVSAEDGDAVAKKVPIQVKFELPYFVVSGIQVRYLKASARAEEPGPPPVVSGQR